MNLDRMKKLSRNSSIELLRIFLILGVIILHYVGDSGLLLNNVRGGTPIYYFIIFTNSLCVCAVDVFVIISGFYMCESNKLSIRKPIQLIVEVIFFQLLLSVGGAILKGKNYSVSDFVYNFVPKNYYVMLYISLMIVSPFLNVLVRSLSKNNYRKMLIVLSALFLVQPTFADIIEGIYGGTIYGISTIGILGAEWGYTIVTFVCLYLLAAYIKKYGSFWPKHWNIIIYFTSLCVIFAWKIIELNIGRSIGAEHYMNPVLIINALSTFEIFRKHDFKSKIINFTSRGCFTVFILHSYFIKYFKLTEYLNDNIILFALRFISYVVIIFILCDLGGIIYCFIEKAIFDIVEKKMGFYNIKLSD